MTDKSVESSARSTILTPAWIGLPEAAVLISRHLFGTDNADRLNKTTVSKTLREAFKSGDIEVLTEFEGDAPITLKSEHSHHPEFTIKMDQGKIWLGQLPGFAFEASLRRSDLQAFLKRVETIPKEKQALDWLISKMLAGAQSRPKATYGREIYGLFKVGAGTFNSLWAKAKQTPGVEGWGRPGRPRKS